MALIKTLAEIQAVLPKVASSLSNFSILNNFDRVENKHIIPLIGRTLYTALQTAYDDNTLSTEQAKLVKHIQLVSAAYAFYDEAALQLVTFGDTGIRKIVQGGTDRIYNWELVETKNSLLQAAYDGTEVLLNYLFDNKATYPNWTSSDQYKRISNLLIRNGTDLNDQRTVYQPQRSFFIMQAVMEDVQLLYIQDDIGKNLLTYLRDVAAPTDNEKECIALLKKALAFFTIEKACKNFSVSFTDNGFTLLGERSVVQGDSGTMQPTDISLLEIKMDELHKDADAYLELAKNKLVALNASSGATAEFKAAFALSPLASYVDPASRTSGNEGRKIYSF